VTGPSLVQKIPIEYGVPECDLETSTTRKPRPTRAVEQLIKETCNVNTTRNSLNNFRPGNILTVKYINIPAAYIRHKTRQAGGLAFMLW
jgi:hypothetical protein